MKHPMVIHPNQLPARAPTVATIAWFLLLDRLQAPAWLWGAIGVVVVISWTACIYTMFVQVPVKLKELSDEEVDL